jgi:hypothetical protein
MSGMFSLDVRFPTFEQKMQDIHERQQEVPSFWLILFAAPVPLTGSLAFSS